MILRCSEYAGTKGQSLTTMKSKGESCISELSSMCGVPMGILLIWYRDNIEDTETIRQRLESILEFYQYDEVIED